MNKKLKPETIIRNLKKDVDDLRKLCQMAGIAPILIYLPQLALQRYKEDTEELKWAKQKAKEFKQIFRKKRKC